MVCSIRTERCACLVLVLCTATGAHAQAAEDADARAAALLGRKAFEAGDYDAAILRYEEARALKPAPGLLFNLAQSHRRAGHLELALFYFRGYLETHPPEPQARVVEDLMQRVQTERQDKERLELERARITLAQRELSRALCAEFPPPPPPVTSRWWFWGIVGAVTAGTVTAVAVAAAPHPAPTTYSPIDAR